LAVKKTAVAFGTISNGGWETVDNDGQVIIQNVLNCCGYTTKASAYTGPFSTGAISNPCSNPEFLATSQTCYGPIQNTLTNLLNGLVVWTVVTFCVLTVSIFAAHFSKRDMVYKSASSDDEKAPKSEVATLNQEAEGAGFQVAQ
jgi:hypothetical protein